MFLCTNVNSNVLMFLSKLLAKGIYRHISLVDKRSAYLSRVSLESTTALPVILPPCGKM